MVLWTKMVVIYIKWGIVKRRYFNILCPKNFSIKQKCPEYWVCPLIHSLLYKNCFIFSMCVCGWYSVFFLISLIFYIQVFTYFSSYNFQNVDYLNLNIRIIVSNSSSIKKNRHCLSCQSLWLYYISNTVWNLCYLQGTKVIVSCLLLLTIKLPCL